MDRRELQRWTIGDTALTAITEAETMVPAGMLVRDARPDVVAAAVAAQPDLAATVADGGAMIGFRVQAFLLQRRDRTILIDPCVGNGKQLTLPMWNGLDLPWLATLAEAGVEPADVDTVIHTHLHEDHIGWDTHLVEGEWVPTFAGADHVYVGDELDFAALAERRDGQDPWADSVEPVLAAGLATQVDSSADLGDGISLLDTGGHTPGHASISIDTGAEPLLITGDVVDHPFQCHCPGLAHGSDWDAAMARRSRSDLLGLAATTGAVIAGTHFPVNPVGNIESVNGSWRFRAL